MGKVISFEAARNRRRAKPVAFHENRFLKELREGIEEFRMCPGEFRMNRYASLVALLKKGQREGESLYFIMLHDYEKHLTGAEICCGRDGNLYTGAYTGLREIHASMESWPAEKRARYVGISRHTLAELDDGEMVRVYETVDEDGEHVTWYAVDAWSDPEE